MRARLIRRDRALQVAGQRAHRQPLDLQDLGQDVAGVRHLRHEPRRHEAAHLDFPQAGIGQLLDPPQLVGARHHAVGHLQSVARPHLAKPDFLVHMRSRDPIAE